MQNLDTSYEAVCTHEGSELRSSRTRGTYVTTNALRLYYVRQDRKRNQYHYYIHYPIYQVHLFLVNRIHLICLANLLYGLHWMQIHLQ